jgi:hypothetical protein
MNSAKRCKNIEALKIYLKTNQTTLKVDFKNFANPYNVNKGIELINNLEEI